MHIHIISCIPDFFSCLYHGVLGKNIAKGNLTITVHNLWDFVEPKKRVDDTPYGGGPGMILRFFPLQQAILKAKSISSNATVIYTSPKGHTFNHTQAKALVQRDMIIICGRYEGIDARIIKAYVDLEISIGDYILSGGEPAALAIIDSVARLGKAGIGNPESLQEESFTNNQLEYPQYTKPKSINGLTVPDVLLSGDHNAIANWKKTTSLQETKEKRPDLLDKKTHPSV